MAGRKKYSKKPLYAQAFTLFCEGVAIGEIARRLQLPPDALADTVLRQRWTARRSTLAGAHSVAAAETRLQAQTNVDRTLCTATEQAASTLAASYVTAIEQICALPVEMEAENGEIETAGARYRQRCHMIERKISLQKAATEGLRELIATAQNVGLLKVERNGRDRDGRNDDDKPIDLSKLTQLNIAIVQATSAGKQGATVVAELARAPEPLNVTPAG